MAVPDEVLMARIAAGDDEALADVYRRYGALVFGIARRITGSWPMAEDVVQEVFCGLWRHPDRFDPHRGSLRAYLGVASHRRAVDAVRRDTRRAEREQRADTLETAPGRNRTAEMADIGTEDAVRRAIQRLPEEQRRAVELAFWQGRTHLEIAEVLGIPEGTVKSRLRLARMKLVSWLAELAVEPA